MYSYDGKEAAFETENLKVVIGRAKPGVSIDLDLSPDNTVSRPHAVISVEGGQYWIEDLNSTSGTFISGEDIRGLGRRELRPGDSIQIGKTTLTLAKPKSDDETKPIDDVPITGEVSGDITLTIDARGALFHDKEQPSEEMRRRLALLYDLPLQLVAETRLDAALQTIVQRLVTAIPRQISGVLLVADALTGQLLLKAHVPAEDPGVSLRRAREAMDRREAFVWSHTTDPDVTVSPHGRKPESAMYAPLLWKTGRVDQRHDKGTEGRPVEALGVLCAVSYDPVGAFTPEDLRLLLALAQYAAVIVVQHRMQEELRANANLMTRLMTNFSPRVRDRLLASARTGRMRLGGQKSEVTVLITDIRGFTKISASLDSEDVVDMLNDYFSALVDVAFRFDGTVDKFIGDAMLVVFGSPEADVQQQDKAVRAALAMQEAIKAVSANRAARGLVTCEMGIGVHCGEALHGFIGSNERMEYTVIGDAVNRATRYCGAAGPGEILISPDVHEWVWRTVRCEPITITIKHEGTLPALRVMGSAVTSKKEPRKSP
jgi:adenylate cyclase